MANNQDVLFDMYNKLSDKIPYRPQLAIVLGSGLGGFADKIDIDYTIDYRDIDNMPKSSVAGHKGRFVFANINGVKTVLMQGRAHYYEGYSTQEVVMPIRLMNLFGAKVMIVTNAAGGVTNFKKGQLMAITDHICMVPSPLIGQNFDKLGVRFPDMTNPYDTCLINKAKQCAKQLGVQLNEGVYIQFSGPNYETKAEVRMAKILGADAVGMSTAVEVIAAAHCGMKTLGISCITNNACGITDQLLTHEDVQMAADRVSATFEKLLLKIIDSIKEDLC